MKRAVMRVQLRITIYKETIIMKYYGYFLSGIRLSTILVSPTKYLLLIQHMSASLHLKVMTV